MSIDQLHVASDASLIVSVGRFHGEALAEVYRRHAGAVFGLARRLLSDRAFAEEIVQEVFMRVWSDPDRFDPDRGSLRSYLLAQCHSRSVDLIRAESRRSQRELNENHLAAETGYDVEHEVWDIVVTEEVDSALGKLPEGERDAILLSYFGGHTYREVADLLDTPEGTVKSRIRSGLKRMRGDLSGVGIRED